MNAGEPGLRELFLLDPSVTFLNHGSFGACPRPVFETYQRWQRELERQPVEFLGRRATELLAEARAALGAYLCVPANDLVYFPNPTTALNMALRALGSRLQPGDEILTTDHEYGSLNSTWRVVCGRAGAHYIQQAMPLPLTTTAEEFVERFWAGVTERTVAVFISHITSPTALTFPVKAICRRARAAGILSIVDGAHAPGQIPLDLQDIGADIYAGACHKWLCGPKSTGFLYAHPGVQPWLEPLVVSWGWESDEPGPSQFVDWHEWQGTRDISAYLTVPAAIQFQAEHDWPAVRARCRTLAIEARRRLNETTGQPALCPDTPPAGEPQAAGPAADWFTQMFTVRLPDTTDVAALKAWLYDERRIEVPVYKWNGVPLMRVSVQGYNSEEDMHRLVEAVEVWITEHPERAHLSE